MINMKDKLTKLLVDSVQKNLNVHYEDNGRISLLNLKDVAKDLLNSGVILPPCKLGDIVYIIIKNIIYEAKVVLVQWCENWDNELFTAIKVETIKGIIRVDFEDLGKTIFLTPEEAEKALREREK